MKIRRLLTAAAVIALAPFCGAAYAANTHVQSFPSGHNGSTNVSSIATGAGTAVVSGDHVMGFAKCWGSPPAVTSITDNAGNTYTIADTGVSPQLGSAFYRWVSFYLLNITNAPTTITVNWSGVCKFNNIVADEFSGSLAGLDVHTGQTQVGVTAGTDAITSGNVTPSTAGSLAYGASATASSTTESNPGTGWTQGTSDQVNDNAYTEWRLNQGATSLAATFGLNTTQNGTQGASTAIMVFKPTALPTPTGMTCVPANPILPDNSAINTAVCNYTVQMSDGSTFTGNVTVSPTSLFGLSASTGNATLQISRALAITDDGTQPAALNAVQNGVNVPLTVNLQVTPTPALGTPVSFGFKGTNPGTSDTPQSGTVVFTAPRPMTVTAITGRVSEPLGGVGTLDVYKASSGTPCASGIKLHMGDFNANGTIDVNQPLQLVADTTVTGNTHTTTTIDNLSTNVLTRGWAVGDAITGSGIPANDTIATIAGNGLSLTLAAAATTTVTADALTVPTPIAQGDNVCITTTGPQWATPAAVDATVTVTAQ